MIAVATGGPRIGEVHGRFQYVFAAVGEELDRRGIQNVIPYSDLWEWYGRWSSGDMPTYQSRRVYVAGIFDPLMNRIRTGRVEDFAPTGWARVDRTVGEVRNRLASARSEEQFQAVGLLCRDVLLSLAQAVYVPERHPSPDGVAIGETDSRRMIEAFMLVELSGANEEARKHARSALALANALVHRRTAGFRDAAMCAEATTSVINVSAILSGRHDPH
jgi:hypothetical protein